MFGEAALDAVVAQFGKDALDDHHVADGFALDPVVFCVKIGAVHAPRGGFPVFGSDLERAVHINAFVALQGPNDMGHLIEAVAVELFVEGIEIFGHGSIADSGLFGLRGNIGVVGRRVLAGHKKGQNKEKRISHGNTDGMVWAKVAGILEETLGVSRIIRFFAPKTSFGMIVSYLKRLIGVSALLLAAPMLWGQTPAELKKKGEKAYEASNWPEALQQLGQYQQQKPGDPGVLTKLGIAHYKLNQAEQAKRLLEFVRTQHPDHKDTDLHFYYARTLHGLQEYEKAIPAYKSFLRVASNSHPMRAFCADNIRRCATALSTPTNDAVALVENLGNRVNTAGDEFGPLPSVNHSGRLYYSAARESCTGGKRDANGLEDLEKGNWCSDMFIAQQKSSGWETTGNLGGLLNTSRFEAALDFNADGQILYFSRGFSLFSGDMHADTAGRKDEYAVESPLFQGPIQMEEGDAAPFFFNDTLLLFASRRAGGMGGLDLYWSRLTKDGVWSPAQNMGAPINSPYDETTPFLAADGKTLFFSTNHIGSVGGLDVFSTTFDRATGKWQTPANVGFPVNSPGDDAFFRLTNDGNTAFLASDRLDAQGARDIYVAYFKQPQREQLESHAAIWIAPPPVTTRPTETQKAILPALPYTNDRDLVAGENARTLDDVVRWARTYPEATVQVTVHTDEASALKFDLYNGIKRAEALGKALTERGLPAERLVLRSVGPNYPLARNLINDTPNPEGARLNRRAEIKLGNASGDLTLQTILERPAVPSHMVLDGGERFDRWATGLSYKVEAAVTRQLLNNDALGMFGELMIETQWGTGNYRYTAGNFKQYSDAQRLRNSLQGQGFAEATVVAYLNGLRLSKAEAVGLVKKWPDLAFYLRG